jgi:hypothetical protein
MSLAKFRKVGSKTGSGRFVVSEGIAPATYLLPHSALPTWYTDNEDDRFEIVIPKGTILSVVTDSNGDSRIVPANGSGSSQTWGDADTIDLETGATPTNVAGDDETVSVAAGTVPIGCAQYDLYRPFDKGTSQGAGWITRGYVEYPLVNGVNANLVAGDIIRADALGRPVKFTKGTDAHYLAVGTVIEVEKFATNFDDGLLSYMLLPSDPGALKEVFELTQSGPYQGKLGIRSNLDTANVVGAIRVSLTL